RTARRCSCAAASREAAAGGVDCCASNWGRSYPKSRAVFRSGTGDARNASGERNPLRLRGDGSTGDMRIGVLIPEFPAQTHIFFWRELQALWGLGIETDLVSTRRPPPALAVHRW